jgi:hypothetical protein
MILQGGYRKSLTPVWPAPICRLLCANIPFAAGKTNPDEEQMGSTPYGNANPAALTGTALPQDIKICRAGTCRVRVDGRA